jgi:hypothetical protein
MGQGGRQPLHTRAVGAENDVDSVAERGTGMRVIAAFFDPCAPYARTSHIAVFGIVSKGGYEPVDKLTLFRGIYRHSVFHKTIYYKYIELLNGND